MPTLLHTESSMNLGGQELRVLTEMEGLAGRGYRSALAARPGSRIIAEGRSRGLECHEVEMRGSIDPLAVAAMSGLMRRLGMQLVNAHGSKDGWCAGLAARMLGVRVVRSRHVANPIRSHFFGRLAYGALCDLVVTTSESIRSDMIARGVDPAKIVSVPTGVDTSVFNPVVEKGRFRASLGLGPDVRIVGMVSVLRGDKGPDVFIRAADEVLASRPDVVFTLAGDGWMRPRLEDMVSRSPHRDRIILAGYRRDVPKMLADIEMMVLPAKVAEGVPQAVLQAHAMKVPVIASEVGGVSEVAIPGRTSVGVQPGDYRALAAAVTALLDDRSRAMELAENGYALVIERYTLGKMLDRMDGVYKDLLGL